MRTRTSDVVRAVGRVTFREIVRDKVLYNILLCALILFGVGMLASRLMIARQERVVLDFGLSAVNISCAMISVFTGSGLLGREFDRRTAFVALSRPISRLQFVLGKFAGLSAAVLLNWALLGSVFVALLLATSPSAASVLSPALAWALLLLAAQSLVLGSLALLVSSCSTTSLAAIITTGLYLVGNNVSQVRLVASKMGGGPGKAALLGMSWVLPNFEHFTVGTQATYGLPLRAGFLATSFLYAIVLTAFALLSAGAMVRWRER